MLFELFLSIFAWLGLLLGLLIVGSIWALILFFVVIETRDLYREFRSPSINDEHGEY